MLSFYLKSDIYLYKITCDARTTHYFRRILATANHAGAYTHPTWRRWIALSHEPVSGIAPVFLG
jgi:hypothetical protein